MCYFEQTQYLACGHNVEMVMEKCELGEKYRTSMHDKIITAIHTDDGKCETCAPPPAYVENANTTTSTTNTPTSTSTSNASNTNATSEGPTSDLPNVASPPTTTNGPVSYPDLSDSTTSNFNPDLIDLIHDDDAPQPKRPNSDRRDSMGEDLMDLN